MVYFLTLNFVKRTLIWEQKAAAQWVAIPLHGLNLQMERKRKDKDTREGEEKSEELVIKDNITKQTEQREKTCNVLAQSQVGQSKDNLDSQEGAKKGNDEFLNTISQGRREEKFGSNCTLQGHQMGSDLLHQNDNEGNMRKHGGRNVNKGLLRYCASISGEQPMYCNWTRQRYHRGKVILPEVSITEKTEKQDILTKKTVQLEHSSHIKPTKYY